MTKNDQHVVPSADGGWAVRKAGAERATKIFGAQNEAISYARTIAKKQHSELYVHAKDGTIRSRDSYGSIPFTSRDKR